MNLTNVSDIKVSGQWRDFAITCKAKSPWNDKQIEHRWTVQSASHFNCCGMRTMQGMDVFTLSPEFQTLGFCKLLKGALGTPFFRGGNVSFVLNPTQRKKLEVMLKNMNRIGAGIQEIPFMNKNMRHLNYLYIWTYIGRKPKKAEVIANASEENTRV